MYTINGPSYYIKYYSSIFSKIVIFLYRSFFMLFAQLLMRKVVPFPFLPDSTGRCTYCYYSDGPSLWYEKLGFCEQNLMQEMGWMQIEVITQKPHDIQNLKLD